MVATLALIRNGELEQTWRLAEKFLTESHDLMHKASGWMLREAGKREERALRKFLDKHASRMPRTMLRYAIERLSPQERAKYLAKKK
jgi:3-methyladenine DNA glycosylase AlkD